MRKAQKKGLLAGAITVAAAASMMTGVGPLVLLGYCVGCTCIGALLGELTFKMIEMIAKMINPPSPQGVPLTASEIAFTKSIFGNQIDNGDLKRVRKYLNAEPQETIAASVPAEQIRRIDFYGPSYHEEDYSQTKNSFNYGTFIHEMTHIWQHQRLLNAFRRERPSDRLEGKEKYEYTLTEKARFKDFGIEQQAAIIEDYARLFLYPAAHASPHWITDTPENRAMLERTVEEKFPEARKSRLLLEPEKLKDSFDAVSCIERNSRSRKKLHVIRALQQKKISIR